MGTKKQPEAKGNWTVAGRVRAARAVLEWLDGPEFSNEDAAVKVEEVYRRLEPAVAGLERALEALTLVANGTDCERFPNAAVLPIRDAMKLLSRPEGI